jgi:DNA helicase-2/ATP-dependent DNA helicase PcrA
MFKPRPPQREVLKFTGGKMGVSAVPGSGKTQTLSALAARLIASGMVGEDQEVLIVTLVNSAVNNFSSRVSGFISEYGLLPDFGYRVRTLHGLAHDIVKERPSLVGLSDRFNILDQRESDEILNASATGWLRAHPDFAVEWTDPQFDLLRDNRILKRWYELATSIGYAFIRTAKDLQVSPLDITTRLNGLNNPLPLLQMGAEIYADYQRALTYRSAVDFDDLIRLALQALR